MPQIHLRAEEGDYAPLVLLPGDPNRATRVAEMLGVSRASAGEMLKRLEAEGLVERGEQKEALLTDVGIERAERVVRKHRLIERLLTDFMGYTAAEAHVHADELGDTFSEGESLGFTGIPHFAPELFRRVRLKDPLKSKQLRQGLQQLAEEGATQVFFPERSNDIILGAVGVLQFDVVASRLKEEYKVECAYEPITVWSARWITCNDKKMLEDFKVKAMENLAIDGGGHLTYLAPTRVNLSLMEERWPDVNFRATREHH